VVQQHAARRLHWDFRLELEGVLKSWAVPKGPSLVAGERRLAAETEDHPLDYADFEGVIPKGEYGAGTVSVWDRGVWQPIGDPRRGLADGKLDFTLTGERLRGRWHLIRLAQGARGRRRPSWLLIKGRDAAARPVRAGSRASTRPVGASRRGGKRSLELAADAAALSGARPVKLRRRVEPQLATLVEAPPEAEGWLHEVKFDGYRLMCRIGAGTVRLVSRNGHDWTRRFPTLGAALRELPVATALLDGEAIVADARGRSHFQALQNALGRSGSAKNVRLVLFDCLHLEGHDVRDVALTERTRLLGALLAGASSASPLRFSDHQVGRGREFFAAACEAGLEGIVSKRLDAPYRAGRTRSWLKTRCSRRQEFVVVGWSEPRGSRIGLGALLLGAHDAAGTLRYCGKVGTGFDDATLATLHARLARLEQAHAPVSDPPRAREVHWVKPRLVAEVSFSEWTRDGRVRHPVFVGLREDKPAAEVRLEVPERATASPSRAPRPPARRGERNVIAGVRLSHADRIYFPDLGVTKRELAEYYEAMAERVLPGIVGRPLTLLRCPEGIGGECFYQKHANSTVPAAVPRLRVRRGGAPYAMVGDLASLVSLVQIGVLELHVWGARADRLDRPDLVVLDLDPDASVPFARVRDTALALRDFLAELGLVAFARVTGGKGLHLVVPIERRSTWDEVRGFARGVAVSLARLAPAHYTAHMSKVRRKGRIYLDWVRNTPEATAIASYSVRARSGAPVALPLSWDELAGLAAPFHANLREVRERLEQPDPWLGFEAARRPLTRRALRRVAHEE
jgi:bifunctional non-homologous end joining protein LigD